MRLRNQVFLVLALAALAVGPVAVLPHLNLHAPTLTADSTPADTGTKLPTSVLPLIGLAGEIKVKDGAAAAAKFKRNAGAARPDYVSGVQGAGPDWERETRAAEPNYEQGVQAAIGRKAFGKGVSKAGAAKYTENATKLGPDRYVTGINQAEPAYQRGVQPHLDALRSLTLPPRGPKGSPQNMERAQVVAARMRAVKVGS